MRLRDSACRHWLQLGLVAGLDADHGFTLNQMGSHRACTHLHTNMPHNCPTMPHNNYVQYLPAPPFPLFSALSLPLPNPFVILSFDCQIRFIWYIVFTTLAR